MTDADLAQLVRDAVRDAIRELPEWKPTVAPILTRREAMLYVRRKSLRSFYDWAKRWNVRPDTAGRWSKTRIDLALTSRRTCASSVARAVRHRLNFPMNTTLTLRHLPRTPMTLREGFWTVIAAVVFAALNALYCVGCFLRAAWDTLIVGKDAAKQLRHYEDDINGRF